jgi:transposase
MLSIYSYATAEPAVDLKNHKVFDVKLGRSEPSLRRYLRGLGERDKVQVVVMDLSETYRSIARRYFPNAIIVADRFHVVRLINQHFLKVWRQHDPEGRKNRGWSRFGHKVVTAESGSSSLTGDTGIH